MDKRPKELSPQKTEFNNAIRALGRSLKRAELRPERVLTAFRRLEYAAVSRVMETGEPLEKLLQILGKRAESVEVQLQGRAVAESLVDRLQRRRQFYDEVKSVRDNSSPEDAERNGSLTLSTRRWS